MYIDEQINFSLLCDNRIRAPAEPAGGIFDHIDLLQR